MERPGAHGSQEWEEEQGSLKHVVARREHRVEPEEQCSRRNDASKRRMQTFLCANSEGQARA